VAKFDVVIIGGGAAGLFCAIEAGKRGRRALVIERNSQVGRKIIISGGGRCNFTNVHTTPENFISQNPHFCKSALARYGPEDFIRLVRKHKIEFYEKTLGQLFCRESSRQIVDMLLKECEKAGVDVRVGSSVTGIERKARFHLTTTDGDVECESLVIASGGLSFQKVGATDFGYLAARQFGLKIEPTRPSLVPLVFADEKLPASLAGISIDSVVSTRGQSFRENILFTHRGLSGPAILQISNYWNRSSPVSIDLLPENDALELLETNRESRQTVATLLSRFLPRRFVAGLPMLGMAGRPLNQLSSKDLESLATKLDSWSVKFRETEGFDKAEVTLGGVSTGELSSQTMETKSVPGLFFIGEVVDVTGWLGGYNFQWAWASGYAAGQAV
jgi:predicted Rossmann fold flavoprotein